MKKQILFVLLITFFIGSKISAQTNNSTTSDPLPEGFPVLVQTGYPETDIKTYIHDAKLWKESHVQEWDLYVRSFSTNGSSSEIKPGELTIEVFLSLGVQKQEYILSHPAHYKFVE